MGSTGHRQLEHTADLALELWAPSEQELLAEGARALTAILTEGGAVGTVDTVQVEVEAIDPADRLVRWLNEVLYQSTVEGFLTADADLDLRADGLRATLKGEAGARARLRTEIKCATYHDLSLRVEADGATARIVLDV